MGWDEWNLTLVPQGKTCSEGRLLMRKSKLQPFVSMAVAADWTHEKRLGTNAHSIRTQHKYMIRCHVTVEPEIEDPSRLMQRIHWPERSRPEHGRSPRFSQLDGSDTLNMHPTLGVESSTLCPYAILVLLNHRSRPRNSNHCISIARKA